MLDGKQIDRSASTVQIDRVMRGRGRGVQRGWVCLARGKIVGWGDIEGVGWGTDR